MEQKIYKMVFEFYDGRLPTFIFIKNGQCVFENHRKTYFKNIPFLKVGDAYNCTIHEPGSQKDHWFCTILDKHITTPLERLQNILKATEIMITQAYSTKEEIEVRSNQLDNGAYFIENIYLMEIHSCFEAIKKYFQQEKQPAFAKQIKKVADDFYETRFDLLGITKGQNTSFYAEGWDPIALIKKVKKQHFSILTPNQKVVAFIHKQIQNEANKSFTKITEICNNFMKEKTNGKNQD